MPGPRHYPLILDNFFVFIIGTFFHEIEMTFTYPYMAFLYVIHWHLTCHTLEFSKYCHYLSPLHIYENVTTHYISSDFKTHFEYPYFDITIWGTVQIWGKFPYRAMSPQSQSCFRPPLGAGDQILWENGTMKKIKKNQTDETVVWMCMTCACMHACACARGRFVHACMRVRMHMQACMHMLCTSRQLCHLTDSFLFSSKCHFLKVFGHQLQKSKQKKFDGGTILKNLTSSKEYKEVELNLIR